MEDDEGELDAPDAGRGALPVGSGQPAAGPTRRSRPSEVDAIVGDPVNNSGFSNFGCTTPQNETSIAANPQNAQNLVAGANDYRVCCDFTGLNDGTGWAYYSFDGGKTWGNVQLPALTAETGAYRQYEEIRLGRRSGVGIQSRRGRVLREHRLQPGRASPRASSSAVPATAARPGARRASFAFINAGNFFNDKEWIAAGPNGQVTVTWTRFSQGPKGAGYKSSPIVSANSKDYGKTWNNQGSPVSDNAHPFNQGSQVQYGPDGALYVSYEATSPSSATRPTRW